MSDSDESGVTHTEISSPFEGLSDIGSPGVVPPSPDYIPGPEEPPSPPPPDFVPEPVYPEFIPPEDEILPAEEQPLPAAASPTAQSPDYVSESDLEEDPEEDDDEDPKEDPADYPADGGDDGDDENESSEDDEDDDVDIEADDDEEEEEHPAPADSINSAATPPPHPAYRVIARISIPAPVPTPVWSDAEIARLLTISTPPSSLLSPWSSPLPQIPSPPLPQIPSPPLPVSSPVPMLYPSPPTSPIRPSGYRAVMIWLRAEASSTSHSLPLPPPIILSHTRPDAPSSGTPPLHLLSTDRREDIPEVTLAPRKRLGITLGPRNEIGESSPAATARPAGGLRADYGFVATMGTPVVTDVAEFSQRMTEFEPRVRRDIDDVYTRLDDEQTGRQLLAGRLNMLFRDRRAHARTARIIETEARMSREAWGRSMDASDLARAEVMLLRTIVIAQHSKIRELTVSRPTQMAELQRQQGLAKAPAQPELPEEAGSSS
ncbi:hypothetical protein Tco_0623892 [Tanacetum coccineum]|uniref:Uncharacterized protein n=1 Tax=Tanacetum coccineum TaxID=301880 RepID=A0ABQ4WCH8_9ASTR